MIIPPGTETTSVTISACPIKVDSQLPFIGFHILIVLSSDSPTMYPSARTVIHIILCVCPYSTHSHSPVFGLYKHSTYNHCRRK